MSDSDEPFPLHDEATAPPEAKPHLAETARAFGMIPNLERVMAAAPALLGGYNRLEALFGETSLSPVEREVVLQTANFENECNYCVPWHTKLARAAGMAPADVEALRQGRALADPRLEALRLLTQALIRTRGKVAKADLDAFFAAGWSGRQALEVVLGIAVKTMSNYTNSIAGTPLDKEVRALAWKKPLIGPRPV